MGRPKKKPEYDSEKIMEQFANCIVEAYMSGVGDGWIGKFVTANIRTVQHYLNESTKDTNYGWCLSYRAEQSGYFAKGKW